MREIKFRAWDKKNKEWLNPNTIGINLNGKGIAPDETWLEHDPSNIALMQFTGLHDKNGKEIWEGDIVKYKYGMKISDEEEEPGEVEEYIEPIIFQEGTFYPIPCGYYPDDYWYGYKYYDFKVIGNIYENPELLEAL